MNPEDVNTEGLNPEGVGEEGVGGEHVDGTDPTDLDTSTGEEQHLRSLMERAAAGLLVETPTGPHSVISSQQRVDAHQNAGSRGTGGLLGVAAALVVLVAIAGAWWLNADPGRDVTATATDKQTAMDIPEGSAGASDSGIAESLGAAQNDEERALPSAGKAEASSPGSEGLVDGSGAQFRIDSAALTTGGIWRLPDGSDSLSVTDVTVRPHESGFQIAVDDVADPSRWMAVLPTRYWMDVGGRLSPTAVHPLVNSMQATVLRPDPTSGPTGSTWIALEQKGDPLNALTFVYRGVSDDEALAMVNDVASSITRLNDAAAVRAALVGLRVPDGLTPTWDPKRVGYPSSDGDTIESLDLTVSDRSSDAEFTVNLNYSGLSPAVARLEQMFGAEASLLNAADDSATTRVDLYPGVLKLSAEGMELLTAFTQDGVSMTVDRVSKTHEVATIPEQVKVLNSLRVVSESDFRSRMRRLGIEIRKG